MVSGGNIDVNILSRVMVRGLIMSGRRTTFTIALPDKPGQLERVAAVISKGGGNVIDVYHSNSDITMPINSCFLRVTIETRDASHSNQIREALLSSGLIPL